MICFRPPQLEDKPLADAVFLSSDYRSCEYTFGNAYIWRYFYKIRIAFADGFVLMQYEINGKPYYIFPAGNGDLRGVLENLRMDAIESGHEFAFTALTGEMKAKLEELYPGKFSFVPVRDGWDYVYKADDLIALSGKKYHSKRNHIRRFTQLGEWNYENLCDENIDECREMNRQWCILNGCGRDVTLNAETCAVYQSFLHYKSLKFDAGILRLNGKIVAFSMGEKLGNDAYNVHIEKAFYDVEGAYPMINREFASHACTGREYVNREEDMGREGLRKAKLSYYPAFLVEKYDAVFTG